MVFLYETLPLTIHGHRNTPSGKNSGSFKRRRRAGVPVQFIFGATIGMQCRLSSESMMPNFQSSDAATAEHDCQHAALASGRRIMTSTPGSDISADG
jgi:hypothetical protein